MAHAGTSTPSRSSRRASTSCSSAVRSDSSLGANTSPLERDLQGRRTVQRQGDGLVDQLEGNVRVVRVMSATAAPVAAAAERLGPPHRRQRAGPAGRAGSGLVALISSSAIAAAICSAGTVSRARLRASMVGRSWAASTTGSARSTPIGSDARSAGSPPHGADQMVDEMGSGAGMDPRRSGGSTSHQAPWPSADARGAGRGRRRPRAPCRSAAARRRGRRPRPCAGPTAGRPSGRRSPARGCASACVRPLAARTRRGRRSARRIPGSAAG